MVSAGRARGMLAHTPGLETEQRNVVTGRVIGLGGEQVEKAHCARRPTVSIVLRHADIIAMDPAMDAGTEVRLCGDQALRLLGLPAKLRGKHRRLVRPAQDGARGVAQDAEPVFGGVERLVGGELRSAEHTSELQSLLRISYAVFRL